MDAPWFVVRPEQLPICSIPAPYLLQAIGHGENARPACSRQGADTDKGGLEVESDVAAEILLVESDHLCHFVALGERLFLVLTV